MWQQVKWSVLLGVQRQPFYTEFCFVCICDYHLFYLDFKPHPVFSGKCEGLQLVLSLHVTDQYMISTTFNICFVLFSFSFFFFVFGRGWCYLFQGGAGVTGAKSSDSMGVGQGTPWMSRQLIAGPLLIAVAATKVPTAQQEQFGVQYLAQGYFSSSVPSRGARYSNRPPQHLTYNTLINCSSSYLASYYSCPSPLTCFTFCIRTISASWC